MKSRQEEFLVSPSTRQEEDSAAECSFVGGHHAEFFTYMGKRHKPEIINFLVARLRISKDDAEDCYANAIEAAFTKAKSDGAHISNPIGYIFTASRFNAIDLIQTSQKRLVSSLSPEQVALRPDIDQDEYEDSQTERSFEFSGSDDMLPLADCSEIGDYTAIAIIEEVEPYVELEEGWAIILVREAISYLPNVERRVIDLLLNESDFDYGQNQHAFSSADAYTRLGVSATAFRKAKSRAFERLRKLIPKVIENLGLQLPTRAEESIFAASWNGPTDDGGD